MLWIYGCVVVLVLLLVVPNALYAFRKFLENRNLLIFCVYLGFLVFLIYLILHITKRTTELAQDAKAVYLDVDA